MNFELSPDQLKGKQEILSFLNDPKSQTLVLKGYAGTGKTTLIQEVVKELDDRATVAFTSTTNKATKVLREMAYASDIEVGHVSTIYSLLGLVLKPDGDVKLVKRGGAGSKAGDFSLVVIDECSMANHQLVEYLQHDLYATDTKFIFMGDRWQLPPVGEENSSSFDMADVSVELTKVVRQAAGNPIIKLTENIRRALTDDLYELELKSAKDSEGHGVYVLPKAKWEAWMRAGFKSDAYRKDGDAFRAIAWRNVAVDYLNNMVREAMYGEESAQPFLKGERVLTAAPIQDEFREEVLASTDSEGTIRAVSEGIHPWIERLGLGELKTYHLKIWFDEVGMVDAYVLHPDSERQHGRTLNNLSSEARADGKLWDTFWTFKDSFHDIRPAHAITSHRSQGSTYDNAFVDVRDIFKNRNKSERLKSLYVACSRARSNLMLLV